MGGEGGDMVFRQVCMVLYFGGGVMEGWMDSPASWVITRFAEMQDARREARPRYVGGGWCWVIWLVSREFLVVECKG